VVDTGLHANKWSREQAIQYMAQQTGMASSDVIAEVERYMVWPAQALGYTIGLLKLQELRQQAKTRLGAAYDQTVWHQQILRHGAMPLHLLEDQQAEWLATQTAKPR
jgi:uncharacterized protein (DUF885 family)